MAHVLYVAWGFPPHRGPGTYRALATVNELAARGHRVTVLTADLDTFHLVTGGDDSLLARVDPRVDVVRVPFPLVLQDPVLSRWSTARVTDPRRWRQSTVERLSSMIPDPAYAAWLSPALAAAVRVQEATPVDVTIATGNPYVDFAVAWDLFRNDGVPFVLDERDSWLHDVYTGEPQPEADAVRQWLAQATADALQLWYVNPPIAAAYAAEFPDARSKIRVVENGWDPAFLPVRADGTGARASAGVVSFIGTVSPQLPLRTLAEGWRLARRRGAVGADSRFQIVGQLGHSGVGTEDQKSVGEEFRADGLELVGRVPKARIHEVYADSDVLVFAKEGGGLVTSGKIYEYVATGLPIAAMIEGEHDARRVLDGYPRWHDAGAIDPEAFAAALEAAVRDATSGGDASFAAARQHGEAFRRDVVLRTALDDLERELGW